MRRIAVAVLSVVLGVGPAMGAIAQAGWVEVGRTDETVDYMSTEVSRGDGFASFYWQINYFVSRSAPGLGIAEYSAVMTTVLANCQEGYFTISQADILNNQMQTVYRITTPPETVQFWASNHEIIEDMINRACR